jgi:hypothetical protein
MNLVHPPLPPRRRQSFRLPADTASGCRDRAAADLLASAAMVAGNGRQRMEASAASWAARAELLQHDEDEFEAQKLRSDPRDESRRT